MSIEADTPARITPLDDQGNLYLTVNANGIVYSICRAYHHPRLPFVPCLKHLTTYVDKELKA